MHCKLCRNTISGEAVKIKNGYVCDGCMGSFPDSIKMNIQFFNSHHLKQLGNITTLVSEDFNAWATCGEFKVSKHSIVLKGMEYYFEDLIRVELNFHPRETGKVPMTAVGTITAVIETKQPHFLIEEPFFPNDVTVGYIISGKAITYRYSYQLEVLFEKIQECIESGTADMTDFFEEYRKTIMNSKKYKEDREKRQQKAAEEAKRKEEEEQKRKAEERRKAQEEFEKKQKKNEWSTWGGHRPGMSGNNSKYLSPFDEAKALFGVQMPYTKEQIRKKRNELLKQYHPDICGSTEMTQKINVAYGLLVKFVAD